MIDIHHHLLFGTDDGPRDLATSVAMVEMAATDGITHIVATPHSNHAFPFDPARNRERLQQIREALPPATAAAMHLGLGCDFHLDWDNTEAAKLHPHRFTLNGHGYLLVELPDAGIPTRIHDVLYRLRVDGLTPILTHPERNATLQRSRDLLREWMGSDLLVQITAGSLTGAFGKTARKMAWELLEHNWVHFVASDAHNLDRRPPGMREAYKAVASRFSPGIAERLFVTNPRAAFDGNPLGAQPAPTGIYADGPAGQPWYRRLFR